MSAKIDPKFIHLFIALLVVILCIFLFTLDSDAGELPNEIHCISTDWIACYAKVMP